MGTYINDQDLLRRYRIFATDSSSIVSSDSIYYAEREIEAALASVYTVPFSEAYPTVKDLCIEATYVRYIRTTNPEQGKMLNDMLQERLDRIRTGEEPIITANSGTLAPTQADPNLPESTTEDYHPIHSMLDAEDNCIDSDLLDTLLSEREND